MVVGQRVVKTAAQRWLGDAGTYPIIVVCGVATAVCSFQCGRYLFGHPDVAWNKTNRSDFLKKYNAEDGSWSSHRKTCATILRNTVNDAKGL